MEKIIVDKCYMWEACGERMDNLRHYITAKALWLVFFLFGMPNKVVEILACRRGLFGGIGVTWLEIDSLWVMWSIRREYSAWIWRYAFLVRVEVFAFEVVLGADGTRWQQPTALCSLLVWSFWILWNHLHSFTH